MKSHRATMWRGGGWSPGLPLAPVVSWAALPGLRVWPPGCWWGHYKLHTHAVPYLPQQGFGNIDGEYWLGLENIYWLTNQGNYKLLVTMEDWSGRKVFAEYASFRLEPESEYYKLRLGRYHGNAGDSFTWHNGKQFTTLDRDHDVYTGRKSGVKPRRGAGKRGQPKPEPPTRGLGNKKTLTLFPPLECPFLYPLPSDSLCKAGSQWYLPKGKGKEMYTPVPGCALLTL